MKKIICKNCNTELKKTDKNCFNCGELNPNIYKDVIEGIISGILAILCYDFALIGFLTSLCGFTYAKRIKDIEKYKKHYLIIIILTITGLILTFINWIYNNI